MIEFECACRQYRFTLPDDMAGGLIQCPRCRRLVDVPTLGEISHIDIDGGYKFDERADDSPHNREVSRLSEAARAFGIQRTDAHGNDIDLRNTFEEVQRAGLNHAPGTLPDGRPVPLKYDPDTGELIRPVSVRGDPPQRVLPVEPIRQLDDETIADAIPVHPPKLDYSAHLTREVGLFTPFIWLLRPVNLLVMAFVLIAHVLLHATAMIVNFGFIFAVFAPLLMLLAVIGHYGNVIEEMGPNGHDELPTLMRNASFFDDVWWPFVQLMIGLFAAYFPLIILPFFSIPSEVRFFLRAGLLVLGTFIAPATVLTQVTSGTLENLRPDRVIGVITVCGARYLVVVGVFVAALGVYLFGIEVAALGALALVQSHKIANGLTGIGGGYIALAAGIYLMHALCWQLGLFYRAQHMEFPWIMQRHVPTRLAERTRARPRAGQLITPAQVKPPTR